MKSVRPAIGYLMTLGVITIAGFQFVFAAPPRAQEGAQHKSPSGPQVMDVELAAGGTLSGSLVNSNGAPVARSVVAIRHQDGDISVETNEEGQFQLRGLRGGVYEIHTAHGGGIIRAWSPRTAPPSALEGIVLVARQNVVRGQQPSNPYLPSTNYNSPSPNSYSPYSTGNGPYGSPSSGYPPTSTYPRTARNSNFPATGSGTTPSNTSPSQAINGPATPSSTPTTGTYGGGLTNTNRPAGTYGASPGNTSPPAGAYGAPATNPSPSTGSYGLTPSNTNPPAGNIGTTPSNTGSPAASHGSGLSNPSPSTGSYRGFTSSNTNPPTGTPGLTNSSPAAPATSPYGAPPQYSSAPNDYSSTPGSTTSPAVSYDMSPAVVHESPRGYRGYMKKNGPLILDLVNLGLGITGTTLGTIALLDDDDDAS